MTCRYEADNVRLEPRDVLRSSDEDASTFEEMCLIIDYKFDTFALKLQQQSLSFQCFELKNRTA